MNESEFEDIVCTYPELIEDGLSLMSRQLYIKGKYVDALFQDQYGQKLIVELKRGTILRKHIAQLLDYEGHFVSQDDSSVRVMLIGTRVPQNLRRSLDHHGFEWLELTPQVLRDFLRGQGDHVRLRYFDDDFVEHANVLDPRLQEGANCSDNNKETVTENTTVINNRRDFDETKYSLASRLALMPSDLQHIFLSFHDLLTTALGPNVPPPRTHVRGVTYFCTSKKGFIFVNFGRRAISMNFYTGSQSITGITKTTWIKGSDNRGGLFSLTSSADIQLAIDYAKKAYRIAINETDA